MTTAPIIERPEPTVYHAKDRTESRQARQEIRDRDLDALICEGWIAVTPDSYPVAVYSQGWYCASAHDEQHGRAILAQIQTNQKGAR